MQTLKKGSTVIDFKLRLILLLFILQGNLKNVQQSFKKKNILIDKKKFKMNDDEQDQHKGW